MLTHDRYDKLLVEFNLRVFTSQLLRATPRWSGIQIRSSFWRLYVNNRSGGSVTAGGRTHRLRPGRIHLVPAWVSFRTGLDRNLKHFYQHFDPVGLPAPLVQELFPAPLELNADAAGLALLEAWKADLDPAPRRDLAAACRAKALLHWTLGRLAASLPPEALERLSRYYAGNAAVLPALEYIEQHLNEALDNPRLAELCHLGVDHFVRQFRRCTGQTPAQYVIDARVKRAAQELFFTRDSIEAIAARAGFRDRFYFSRVFARRMGQGPAGYRRSNPV